MRRQTHGYLPSRRTSPPVIGDLFVEWPDRESPLQTSVEQKCEDVKASKAKFCSWSQCGHKTRRLESVARPEFWSRLLSESQDFGLCLGLSYRLTSLINRFVVLWGSIGPFWVWTRVSFNITDKSPLQTSSVVGGRIPDKARWYMEQACHQTAIKRPTFEQLEKSLRSVIGGGQMNLLDRYMYSDRSRCDKTRRWMFRLCNSSVHGKHR